MKLILILLIFSITSIAVCKPNHPDCRKTGEIHPKTRAECLFHEVVEGASNSKVNSLIKELNKKGFLAKPAGSIIELSSTFTGGHCDRDDILVLNCTWTYLVKREFSKYPGDIGDFGDFKTLIGVVEASNNMSVQPKLIKVYNSDQLL